MNVFDVEVSGINMRSIRSQTRVLTDLRNIKIKIERSLRGGHFNKIDVRRLNGATTYYLFYNEYSGCLYHVIKSSDVPIMVRWNFKSNFQLSANKVCGYFDQNFVLNCLKDDYVLSPTIGVRIEALMSSSTLVSLLIYLLATIYYVIHTIMSGK